MNWCIAITTLFSLRWLTEPEMLMGALGLLATLYGFYLTYRAEKKSAENLSEERERILKGVADVVAALHPPALAPDPPAESAPENAAPKRASAPPPAELHEPDRSLDLDGDALNLQAEPGEYVGTVDVTGDGDPDLLVERVFRQKTNLKIFSWQDFDLVLVAEFDNKTGAHFHPENSSIATVDWRDGKLVKRVFTWQKRVFREHLDSDPFDAETFSQRPEWSI